MCSCGKQDHPKDRMARDGWNSHSSLFSYGPARTSCPQSLAQCNVAFQQRIFHECGLDATYSGQQHCCSSSIIVPVVVAVAVAAAPVATETISQHQEQQEQEQEQATQPPPPQNPTVGAAETTTRTTTTGTAGPTTTIIIQPFFFSSLHTVPVEQYLPVLGSNNNEAEESMYR